jgi:hypothetical protein
MRGGSTMDTIAVIVLALYTAPVQRVPAIEDFNFLRDMRRMTQ